MLKFSVKYYLKCILVSLIFFICGGYIIGLFATHDISNFSLIAPVAITVIGFFIRMLILKRQLNKENISDFEAADYFKMCLPGLCLLVVTAIVFLCDIFINKIGNSMAQLVIEGVKFAILVLFPGGLTLDLIICTLIDSIDTAYYIMLIINILFYTFPALIYMRIKSSKDRET